MKSSKIKQPIAILGRGRCGTSALAGALESVGWKFSGIKPPNSLTKRANKIWICGYFEVEKVPKSGNYKITNNVPKIRGDETVILMTRKLDSQAKSLEFISAGQHNHNDELKAIMAFNKKAKKLNPVIIKFEDLLKNPTKVLGQFDVDKTKAAEFIKPSVSMFI